ncbi:MAG TPA: hypothetical protein VKT78_05205 [Fimbriimonadaceae bacterium]|nr:hypothetical protein [Fimbriimonadaceae bacterium]
MVAPGYIPPVQEGDRVRLASGGAIMTAEKVLDGAAHPYAKCVWIDRWSRVHREPFGLTSLTIVPWDEGGPSERPPKDDTS